MERYGIPFREGDNYFFTKNDGLQNQAVLCSAPTLAAEPKVLLDPNTLSEDGTVALGSYEVSPNGRHLVYSTSASGSDWVEWHVRDIETGKDLEDHLKWSKFSGASWSKDSKGFYYGRFPTPDKGEEMTAQNTHKKIYYHRLGNPQEKDELVYERPEQPKEGLYAWVSDDGRYLLIQISRGTDTKNGLFYRDLSKPDSPVVELLPEFDASYDFVSNLNSTFLIRTDLKAPKQKVIAIDLSNPERKNWKTIIPESEETLRSVSHVGGTLIANYLKDARTEIRRFKTMAPAFRGRFLNWEPLRDFTGRPIKTRPFTPSPPSPSVTITATTPLRTLRRFSNNQPLALIPTTTNQARFSRPRRMELVCQCLSSTEKDSSLTAQTPPSFMPMEVSTSHSAPPTRRPPSPGST